MAEKRKNAIITGAASGLGRALALQLAKERWNIAIVDINEAGAKETLEKVRQAGGEGRVEIVDVTKYEAWLALRDRLSRDWENLDLLVNNAGVAGGGEMGKYTIEDWHWIVNINLWNGIYGCHVFVDWLKRNPKGAHIINTASMAAVGSAPTMAAYNVTKAGMLSLSETLYAELMEHNVGVTVVCPSFFATNLLTGGRFADPKQKEWALVMFQNAGFTADDVAHAALDAMRKKKLYVMVPFASKVQWWYKRLAPASFLRYVARMFKKMSQQAA
ncbi:MAG: SDR family NAD(P)-dependent oxidoreductase [Planctomycetota bacterium]